MRVLIVDDHPITRLGLKLLLERLDSKVETAEAGRLAEAIETGERGETFELVMLDVRLPDGNGVERLKAVKEAFEGTPIVIMSAEKEPKLIFDAIDAGASGYIPKDTPHEVTVNALRLVLESGIYLPPEVLQRSALARADRQGEPEIAFTEAQLGVLQKLLHGSSNKVMARQLAVSESAIKKHLEHIFDKLGVSSRTEAMAKVMSLPFLFERLSKLTR